MDRNAVSLLILPLSVGFLAYCASTSDETPETVEPVETIGVPPPPQVMATALADLFPTEGSETNGSVTFEQTNGRVKIVLEVRALTPGKHGFHIHEGDCSQSDASSAGAHLNPGGTQHGAPDSPTHHAGDLGNIEADAEGNASFQMTVDFLSLLEGPNSVIGKAVVVEAEEDDFDPSRGDGASLACGVIQM
jgi:Cu-Zn family superoxide dismutase